MTDAMNDEIPEINAPIKEKTFAIPKIHMNRIIKEILNKDRDSKKLKITQKALRFLHMHTENFVYDAFQLSTDLLSINKSKTLNRKAFKMCLKWITKDICFQQQKSARL